MDTKKDTDRPEYTEPEVIDYGSLQDLTASGGKTFSDVPLGAPVNASSTP
jgi:hypothetical protein